MSEEEKDYKPLLKQAAEEYQGAKFFFERITLGQVIVIVLLLINTITSGLWIYLYFTRARPMAEMEWKNLRAVGKSLDSREKMLDLRERRLKWREDTLNNHVCDTSKIIE